MLLRDAAQSLSFYAEQDLYCGRVLEHVKRIAARVFQVSRATISLVRHEREWFERHCGLRLCDVGVAGSLYDATLRASSVFVVPDTLVDARFAEDALVVNEPYARFYAGAPLINAEGEVLGVFCVLDSEPGAALTEDEAQTLVEFATIVADALGLRKALMMERKAEANHPSAAEVQRNGELSIDREREVIPLDPAAERGNATVIHGLTEEANRAKSEFLSRMSHELRTPMNAILGFAQVLEMDELTADQRESVEHILRSGQHLLELINDVLDVTQVEAGRLTFAMEPVQSGEAVREVVELLQPIAAQYGVHIPSGLQMGGEFYVLADRQRLRQVLLNLITNAVKYNRKGGEVRIEATAREPDRVRFVITDTGIGIPAERLGQLFMPFQRLEMELSEVEGTGLGLVLSKTLVEAMNGEIGVESELGQGTAFWIELERVEAPGLNLPSNELGVEGISDPSYTVLYVEDNFTDQQLMRRILMQRPTVKLHTASQGKVGLEAARQLRPDLILVDLHLPDVDGNDLLQSLSSDPRTETIPTVVVSADASDYQVKRLLSEGVHHYLPKPLNVPHFLCMLDELLIEREGGYRDV